MAENNDVAERSLSEIAKSVDSVAKQTADSRRLYEELSRTNKIGETALMQITETVRNLSELEELTLGLMDKLKIAQHFTMEAVAAQNGDRKSYDKLKAWAKDKSFPWASKAEAAWRKIHDEASKPMYIGPPTLDSWMQEVRPGKVALSELRSIYKSE